MSTTEDRREAEQAALGVVCPLEGAQPGEPCTYRMAVRDDATGVFLHWEHVVRGPHQPRVAVATDGRWYRQSLQALLRSCTCGDEAAMAGQHSSISCPWTRL